MTPRQAEYTMHGPPWEDALPPLRRSENGSGRAAAYKLALSAAPEPERLREGGGGLGRCLVCFLDCERGRQPSCLVAPALRVQVPHGRFHVSVTHRLLHFDDREGVDREGAEAMAEVVEAKLA
jgi:hypothetical protein